MPLLSRLSAADQVAAYLRAELGRGRWSGVMPGQFRLAAELGVARNTVEEALRRLEREGLLLSRGPGRRREIAPSLRGAALRPLRVAILLHERDPDQQLGYMVELRHELGEAGHVAFFPQKSLIELGMDVPRVARLVNRTEAEAWVVCSGSREVLEWFQAQPTPAFAMFGRREGVRMAATGPDKPLAYSVVARHLIELGHRRIVLVARRIRRLPEPGLSERAFLDELEAHGIRAGEFNLPNWKETKEGFQELLESLFRLTPPTALILDEAPFFIAAQQFLARRGKRVPEEVSLVCTDTDPTFAWCEPSIAHIRWDSRPVVRRIVRWVAKVSRGQRDERQSLVPAEFVEGGTVGPASQAILGDET